VCGFAPIAIALSSRNIKAPNKESLSIILTSADTCGDSTAVVGYAGISWPDAENELEKEFATRIYIDDNLFGPGKIYLFGEHAVVYGEPAIACAINLRVCVSVELASSGKITIDAMDKRANCSSEEFKYACLCRQDKSKHV